MLRCPGWRRLGGSMWQRGSPARRQRCCGRIQMWGRWVLCVVCMLCVLCLLCVFCPGRSEAVVAVMMALSSNTAGKGCSSRWPLQDSDLMLTEKALSLLQAVGRPEAAAAAAAVVGDTEDGGGTAAHAQQQQLQPEEQQQEPPGGAASAAAGLARLSPAAAAAAAQPSAEAPVPLPDEASLRLLAPAAEDLPGLRASKRPPAQKQAPAEGQPRRAQASDIDSSAATAPAVQRRAQPSRRAPARAGHAAAEVRGRIPSEPAPA